VAADPPDLVVLDINMPRMDGLEVCRRLRARSELPILFLSSRDDEIDRVLGIELGADDYVVKPFSPRELVARVDAVMRRTSTAREADERLDLGALQIDPAGRMVSVRGREVDLTAREFELLLFLARNPGRVFSRDQLMERVWDIAYPSDTTTVTVHVRRLRAKIEADASRPEWIETVWGVGYRFRAVR
jgi:two-component system, OmpR family, response regulator ResD